MDLHVIIPSISNPCGLIATLQGLISLESGKQNVLYSVVADATDERTIEAVNGFKANVVEPGESLVECCEKQVYVNLNRYINALANEEDAELTMVLCDDVLPLTPSWDYVASLIKCPLFAWTELNNRGSFTYPCVQKIWRELTGYVLNGRFPYWFADAWSAEVWQMATDTPVPIIDGLVLGGKRGKTRGFRDLPFWLDYWIRTRCVRIAEAKKIKGGDVEKGVIAQFEMIDQVHLKAIPMYNQIHDPEEGEPSIRYKEARIEAVKWMAENPVE